MRIFYIFLAVFGMLVCCAAAAFTAENNGQRGPLDGGNGTVFGRGGDAISQGAVGTPGMPGCDGGSNPNSDGKFYILGTKQQCNPSKEDRKKLN